MQNLDAGDRFELPMHLAYETGVVATLPASIFIPVALPVAKKLYLHPIQSQCER